MTAWAESQPPQLTAWRRVAWFAAVCGALGTWSCRCSDQEASNAAVSTASAVERGDHVLVEVAAGEFFQGRVLARAPVAGASQLKVQRADGELVQADEADVYRLEPEDASAPGAFAVDRRPAGSAEGLAPGALAICRRPRAPATWVGCRVVAQAAASFEVEDYSGERFTADMPNLALPSELTRMNLELRFRAADRALNFQRASRAAGDPAPTRGWVPGLRERVIAKLGDEWFSAYIVRFYDDGSYRVEWVTNRRESDVQKRFVISEPPYPPPSHSGGFALRKPSALSRAWQRVKIVSVRPELIVADASGEQRAATWRELVPLGQRLELDGGP